MDQPTGNAARLWHEIEGSELARLAGELDATDAVRTMDSATLAIESASEHAAYQNAQSEAHAGGTLATKEAAYVYALLGETYSPANDGYASGATTGDKIVVTKIIHAILSRKVAGRTS